MAWATLLALTACEPCSGVASCRTAPTVALTGQVVDGGTGAPVRGTVVTVGASRAVTDDDGLWTVAQEADSTVRSARVTVQAPGKAAYTIASLPVTPLTTRGDVQNVGRWTSTPYARFMATLMRAGVPVPGASVSFVPAGGVPAVVRVGSSVSNGAGIFELHLEGTGNPGDVTGILTVTSAALARVSRFEGFGIPLEYRYEIPRSRGTIAVGGTRTYGGEVIFRGTGEKSPGASVEFVRTGGVAITPASVRVTSDSRGFFLLPLDASLDGVVTGSVTVRSADGQRASIYQNVSFATYDSTSFRSSGLWAYGERLAWALELWTHDRLAPAPNVNVEFRRTGGLAISPDRIAAKTGNDGRFEVRASVLDTGTVVGDIVVSPATGPNRVIPNVRLRTFEGDNLRFAGVFGFGPALRYVGEVLRQDGTPVQGAQVTWTQVSGVAASPSVLTGTTDANGRFPLTLIPSIDGEVVGEVRVVPPAPWTAGTQYTFTNLRLNSFESGDLRLAVTYRIPNP